MRAKYIKEYNKLFNAQFNKKEIIRNYEELVFSIEKEYEHIIIDNRSFLIEKIKINDSINRCIPINATDIISILLSITLGITASQISKLEDIEIGIILLGGVIFTLAIMWSRYYDYNKNRSKISYNEMCLSIIEDVHNRKKYKKIKVRKYI